MNKQITALAKQSGLVMAGDWGMKRWEGSRSESMMSDIRWAYYVDCGVDSVVGIREHFGIEE